MKIIKPYDDAAAVKKAHLYMESEQRMDLDWWERRLRRQRQDYAIGTWQQEGTDMWGIFLREERREQVQSQLRTGRPRQELEDNPDCSECSGKMHSWGSGYRCRDCGAWE